MVRKPKFKPEITRVKLNPEQAVLSCNCYSGGQVVRETSFVQSTWVTMVFCQKPAFGRTKSGYLPNIFEGTMNYAVTDDTTQYASS